MAHKGVLEFSLVMKFIKQITFNHPCWTKVDYQTVVLFLVRSKISLLHQLLKCLWSDSSWFQIFSFLTVGYFLVQRLVLRNRRVLHASRFSLGYYICMLCSPLTKTLHHYTELDDITAWLVQGPCTPVFTRMQGLVCGKMGETTNTWN